MTSTTTTHHDDIIAYGLGSGYMYQRQPASVHRQPRIQHEHQQRRSTTTPPTGQQHDGNDFRRGSASTTPRFWWGPAVATVQQEVVISKWQQSGQRTIRSQAVTRPEQRCRRWTGRRCGRQFCDIGGRSSASSCAKWKHATAGQL